MSSFNQHRINADNLSSTRACYRYFHCTISCIHLAYLNHSHLANRPYPRTQGRRRLSRGNAQTTHGYAQEAERSKGSDGSGKGWKYERVEIARQEAHDSGGHEIIVPQICISIGVCMGHGVITDYMWSCMITVRVSDPRRRGGLAKTSD